MRRRTTISISMATGRKCPTRFGVVSVLGFNPQLRGGHHESNTSSYGTVEGRFYPTLAKDTAAQVCFDIRLLPLASSLHLLCHSQTHGTPIGPRSVLTVSAVNWQILTWNGTTSSLGSRSAEWCHFRFRSMMRRSILATILARPLCMSRLPIGCHLLRRPQVHPRSISLTLVSRSVSPAHPAAMSRPAPPLAIRRCLGIFPMSQAARPLLGNS